MICDPCTISLNSAGRSTVALAAEATSTQAMTGTTRTRAMTSSLPQTSNATVRRDAGDRLGRAPARARRTQPRLDGAQVATHALRGIAVAQERERLRRDTRRDEVVLNQLGHDLA